MISDTTRSFPEKYMFLTIPLGVYAVMDLTIVKDGL